MLSQWIDCADQWIGDHTDVRRSLHEHRQGLDGFDKIIGCQWSSEGKTHPDCGADIRNYAATCARFYKPPSGRVILAMVCQTSRVDRAAADDIHVGVLLMSDVRQFVERVDASISQLAINGGMNDVSPGQLFRAFCGRSSRAGTRSIMRRGRARKLPMGIATVPSSIPSFDPLVKN